MPLNNPTAAFTGGGTFTASNTYNDNVYAIFGTDSDTSLGYATTGVGASSPGLFFGLANAAPFFFIGNEANKGFDPIGIDISGFFSDPLVFILSSDQVKNEHARFQINGTSRDFSFNGSNGDNLDGTTTTDDGIGLDFRAGAGGSSGVGGDGGTIAFRAGDGGGTNSDGGNIEFSIGAAAGAGLPGEFSISQGSTLKWNLKQDGSFETTLADNINPAYKIVEGANTYFQIVTTNSSESIQIGNTSNDPDVAIVGTGQKTIQGDVHFDGNASGGSRIFSSQNAAPGIAKNATTLDAGGGTGSAAAIDSNSTDMAGTVTITAGNGTPTAGVIATLTFSTTYTNAPKIQLTAADVDAADNQLYVTNVTATTFDIAVGAAMNASESIDVNYQVTGILA